MPCPRRQIIRNLRSLMRPARTLMIHSFLAVFLMFPAIADDAASSGEKQVTLVAFGDSLTAGYGLRQEEAFPAVLEKALREKGHRVSIINAGVSGDTVQAGLERIDWSIPDGVDGVIVELGANDMLRGIDPAITKANLEAIIQRLEGRGIPVILAGMMAAPNLGQGYAEKFNVIFPEMAKKYSLILYPFFIDGTAGQRALNLPDGMHPTGEGVKIIVQRILPSVEAFLARISTR